MKVWIVSKIDKKGYAWVHGLTEENQNVRLLRAEGSYPSKQSRFQNGVTPPDQTARKVKNVIDLEQSLAKEKTDERKGSHQRI